MSATRGSGFALLALLGALCGCDGGADGARERPRHLLLITVDTLRADHLGIYGHPGGISPNIDALGERGLVFEQAHAPASWTLASLASVMTSTPSSVHGCWDFKSSLAEEAVTLAEVLAAAGYRTSAVVSHVFLGPKYGLHQGFGNYDTDLVQAGLVKSHEAISSPEVSAKGVSVLKTWSAEPELPQFLWLHYFDPHSEYQAHPAFVGRFGSEEQQDLYRGEIAFTDRAIGRVLDALEELGLAQDTVVAFTSDHGEEWGEHGGLGHGTTLHAEQVRVPLILAGPGLVSAAPTIPVSTLDLAPTLLRQLDVGAPPSFLGRAYPSFLEWKHDPDLAPTVVEELRLRPGRWANGLRDGEWHLIQPAGARPARLYQLREDPLEQRDLASEESVRVEQMGARLAELLAAYGERALGANSLTHTDEELQRLSDLGYADGPEDR